MNARTDVSGGPIAFFVFDGIKHIFCDVLCDIMCDTGGAFYMSRSSKAERETVNVKNRHSVFGVMPGKLEFPKRHINVTEYAVKVIPAGLMLFWNNKVFRVCF